MMEREGWSVVEAENGKVGLERLAENLSSLILLDLMMPVMDGFSFVEALRANSAWNEVPVIVVTAKDITKEDRDRLNGRVVNIMEKGSGLELHHVLSHVHQSVRAGTAPTPTEP